MRLIALTFSAALLSGCSWLGYGGHQSSGFNGGSYADCYAYGQQMQYGQYSQYGQHGMAGCAGYGQAGYGAGAGQGGGLFGWGAGQGAGAGAGYGAGGAGTYSQGTGYGAGGAGMYSQGTGYGAGGAGMYGQGAGYGTGAAGMYGQGAAMTGAGGVYTGGSLSGAGGAAYGIDQATGQRVLLNGGTAYGTSVTGGTTVGGVQRVIGAPLYVNQPYPVYYGGGVNYQYAGWGGNRLRLRGGSNPLGFAAFGGVSSFSNGDVFGSEPAKPAGATGRSVSALDAIGYDAAFDDGNTYGGAVEYDLDRQTTAFVQASRTEYEGQTVTNGTITQDNTASGGAIETGAGIYSFSDLNETTIEGGVRRYMGNGYGLRPYVGASAGFTHNNRVDLTATSDNAAVIATPETQEFIREGWQPTAAGIIGAEMAVGPNAALGVETGIRWTDDRATNLKSEDSWSVPVSLRGRIAF